MLRLQTAADFNNRMKEKEEIIASLGRDIEALRRELDALTAQHKTSEEQSKALQLRVQELQAQCENHQSRSLDHNREIERLKAEITTLQTQLDASALKIREQQDRITDEQRSVRSVEERLAASEHERHRVEITRNRVVAWRRDRLETRSAALYAREVVLAWRAAAVRLQRARVASRDAQLTQRVHVWNQRERDVQRRLAMAQATLRAMHTWLQHQRQELHAWCELFVLAFSTQVTERIKLRERELDAEIKEHERLHALTIDQLRCEYEAQLAQSNDANSATRDRFKRRVTALCTSLVRQRERALRAQAFSGWKDVYLRSAIAQATHAVMVQRAARALLSPSSVSMTPAPSTAMAKALDVAAVAPMPTQLPMQKIFGAREMANGERELEETQWRRWRRLTELKKTLKARANASQPAKAEAVSARGAFSAAPTTARRRASVI
ncbi:hypothetical protein PINS_up013795 [Pythium insidiosum]|nr:hypothetical protein PINS_up013795 [Pythium insidiosum]